MDNHASHVSLRIVEAAIANNIELFFIPPHSSDRLQPLDVGVYGPLKLATGKLVLQFYQQNGFHALEKAAVTPLLTRLCNQEGGPALTSAHAQGGFAECGLYPVNRQRVLLKLRESTVFQSESSPQSMSSQAEAGPSSAYQESAEDLLADEGPLSPAPSISSNLQEESPTKQYFANALRRHFAVSTQPPGVQKRRRISNPQGGSLTSEEARFQLALAEEARKKKKSTPGSRKYVFKLIKDRR